MDFPLGDWNTIILFSSKQGLHQGYLISPLLFIIVVEPLSRKLGQEREIGNLHGLQITRVKNMNHSQYADDTLLFEGASVTIETRFKITLDSFFNTSGGDVNKKKCQFYAWNTSPQIMWEITQVFQFPLAKI